MRASLAFGGKAKYGWADRPRTGVAFLAVRNLPAPGTGRLSTRVLGFLVAEALSAVGSWATIVVVWGYAAYEYDATAADVTLVGLAFVIPGVLISPLAGAVVDRLGPKTTLAIAKALGIVSALAMLAADSFAALAALSALHGIVSTLSHPALQSMPPRLVEADQLARTNALVSLTDELAIVLGPVAAGVGIAAFGFRGAFVFDAVTYAVGLVALPLVQLRPASDTPPENLETILDEGSAEKTQDPRSQLYETLEGWRLIVANGRLRRVVTCTFVVHLLYGAAILAEPLYVRDTLQRSEEVFAALQTAFGICLVAGGIVAVRVGERLASFGWVAAGTAGSGLAAIVYLGTPQLAVAFGGVALWGLMTAVIGGPSRTLLQRASPERAHGRIMAADLTAGSVGELVGIGAAGVLIAAFSVPWAVLVLGVAVAVVAIGLDTVDRRDRGSPVPPTPDGPAPSLTQPIG